MKSKKNLVISIVIPLAVGGISGFLSRKGMEVYKTLNKPSLSPPDFVFPIVWTGLYILMGVSSYLIYNSNSPKKMAALYYYVLQLIFNFFWSIIFFRNLNFIFAFYWLLAMIILIIAMILSFRKIDKRAAAANIPYLVWSIFAAYLNYMAYILNR